MLHAHEIAWGAPASGPLPQKESQATATVRLVIESGAELWHTPDGDELTPAWTAGHPGTDHSFEVLPKGSVQRAGRDRQCGCRSKGLDHRDDAPSQVAACGHMEVVVLGMTDSLCFAVSSG